MEFKILIYLIGAVIYFVFKQYQKLQKEALKRKVLLKDEITLNPKPIVPEILKPVQKVKVQRQQMDAESARLRERNKMQSAKTPKPFFETPEHYISSLSDKKNMGQVSASANVLSGSDENNMHEGIDIRKMILYSELLKRPAW
jgi:hypothetical protein